MNLRISQYVKKVKLKNPHWKSNSRIIGEAIEEWACNNLLCPKCSAGKCEKCARPSLTKLPNNFKSADFRCSFCNTLVQVKAKKESFFTNSGEMKKIIGAEYKTTVNSLKTKKIHYYLIAYSNDCVREIYHVEPKSLKFEQIIPRNPLQKGKRIGWQGCHIKLEKSTLKNKMPPIQLNFWNKT